jgi:hypothetical protein
MNSLKYASTNTPGPTIPLAPVRVEAGILIIEPDHMHPNTLYTVTYENQPLLITKTPHNKIQFLEPAKPTKQNKPKHQKQPTKHIKF